MHLGSAVDMHGVWVNFSHAEGCNKTCNIAKFR